MTALIAGLLALVPGQRVTILGIELLVLAAVVLTWTVTIQVHAGPIPDAPSRGLAIRGSTSWRYWRSRPPVVAVANAWVLVIEIDR